MAEEVEKKENSLVDEVREVFTVKTLQERVQRLETENKELKGNNLRLESRFQSQCETQSDILRTLHANLDANYSKIDELQNLIHGPNGYEQQLEDQKQAAKDELEAQRAQWEARVAELQTKNDHLEAELHKVTEFRQNKAEMEAELASLKKQLKEQDEEHAQSISAFDRKKAMEIDQLKKDMHRSIKETREMLKNRTKDQLDTTTKRTIMENEQMATELDFQSKQTEQLLNRNQSLMEENAQLRRNLLIHKDLENELARRTHVYQKLIKRMKSTDKSMTGEGKFDATLDGRSDISGLQSRADDFPANSEVVEENEKLKRQLEGIQSTLQMVRHEFAQYRRDHATLTQLQDHSTRLIIATLYELKNQRESDPFPPPSYDENANWQFTNMTPKQKEYFFRVLLEKLNSSMCGTCFPIGPNPLGPAPSSSSLPQLVPSKDGSCKDPLQSHTHSHGSSGPAHFSQFLWSVATHGGQVSTGARVTESKGCQTEADTSDPCFKEGLWSQTSKGRTNSESSAKHAVLGSVRPWGGVGTKPIAQERSRKIAGRAV
eukprot:TRINITY_DN93306_c0_g1_i1.p1 TRINITY_DN93306_c0_g1~~TRINITY_DN93306_c0_g1_i1.p1  ORF type:complete len:547 (-),score=149.42 TRINITY_DN93306_c0_g1_i1:96-1736(-)